MGMATCGTSRPGCGGGVRSAVLDRELHRDGGDRGQEPRAVPGDIVALIARFDVVASEIDR
jgi:hypothetical protein